MSRLGLCRYGATEKFKALFCFVLCTNARISITWKRSLHSWFITAKEERWSFLWCSFNSSPPGQNGRHFADDIFKRIFKNENCSISIRISPKFVPKGPIDNKSALVQAMAWRRTGDKPLPESMLTQFTDAYMQHEGRWVLNTERVAPHYWLVLCERAKGSVTWIAFPCYDVIVTASQWVNSVPPYVRKLHFMYEVLRTSSKCRWGIYRTPSKCQWSIYRTSRKRRGTLRVVHQVERSSPHGEPLCGVTIPCPII